MVTFSPFQDVVLFTLDNFFDQMPVVLIKNKIVPVLDYFVEKCLLFSEQLLHVSLCSISLFQLPKLRYHIVLYPVSYPFPSPTRLLYQHASACLYQLSALREGQNELCKI